MGLGKKEGWDTYISNIKLVLMFVTGVAENVSGL